MAKGAAINTGNRLTPEALLFARKRGTGDPGGNEVYNHKSEK